MREMTVFTLKNEIAVVARKTPVVTPDLVIPNAKAHSFMIAEINVCIRELPTWQYLTAYEPSSLLLKTCSNTNTFTNSLSNERFDLPLFPQASTPSKPSTALVQMAFFFFTDAKGVPCEHVNYRHDLRRLSTGSL